LIWYNASDMQYLITHQTHYQYDRPVCLAPHLVRLRPRSDGWQTLQQFAIQVTPAPLNQSQILDLEGNTTIKLWFEQSEVTRLEVKTISQVETHQENPFNYLIEPWAGTIPIDYPTSLRDQLQPYLAQPDPIAHQLAQEIWLEANGELFSFLNGLNQRIYRECEYFIRDTGDPLPPTITWNQKRGTCRDFALLFMHVCKAVGLACRFVSGYQEGDETTTEFHLHAWVEVYLPGAGWRGYDPTHGLAVADRHIALVASAQPKYTTPIEGKLNVMGGAVSSMSYELSIDRLETDH
jgi:transglutaminase-like putative cysteine protease